MPRLPFREKFDRLFRGNGPAWGKILGAAAVSGFVVFEGLRYSAHAANPVEFTPRVTMVVTGLSAMGGGVVAAVFVAKDAVRWKLDHGVRVHPLLAWTFRDGHFEGIGIFVIVITIVTCCLTFF